MDSKRIQRARDRAYHFFLQGERIAGSDDTVERCRRAELVALTGDFPRAFRLIQELKKASSRRKWLARIISAFKRSIQVLPKGCRGQGPCDLYLLLDREYYDAARMWVRFEGGDYRWKFYLDIYRKTTLPIDIEAARKRAGDYLRIWLEIAELSCRIDDIHKVDTLLEKELNGKPSQSTLSGLIIRLVSRHRIQASFKHLELAVTLADTLDESAYYYGPTPVEAWKAIVSVSNSPEHRSKLRAARLISFRLEKEREWSRESFNIGLERGEKPDLNDPAICLGLAWQRKSIWHLNRALRLLRNYRGADRTHLFLWAFDLLDGWAGKVVLRRHAIRHGSNASQPPPINVGMDEATVFLTESAHRNR